MQIYESSSVEYVIILLFPVSCTDISATKSIVYLTCAINYKDPGGNAWLHGQLSVLNQIGHVVHTVVHFIFMSCGLGETGIDHRPTEFVKAHLSLSRQQQHVHKSNT